MADLFSGERRERLFAPLICLLRTKSELLVIWITNMKVFIEYLRIVQIDKLYKSSHIYSQNY